MANDFRKVLVIDPSFSFVLLLLVHILSRVRLYQVLPDNQAKTNVARGGVHWLRHARRGTISAAIVRSTEKGAALDDLARDSDARHLRVVALLAIRRFATQVSAARLDESMAIGIPIGGPF